jgi:hypothetical protein
MGRLTRHVSLPALIAAAGVAVVLSQWLGNRPLWLDEEMIAINLRDRSLTALGGRLWLDQSAPLGWLGLQRLMLLALGSSELVLRAVPALFGAATVVAAFFVGRRWLTGAGCAVFVILCSFGEWISFYAVELKSYSADTFWGLSLPALAVAAAGDSSIESRRKNLAIWAIAAAIGHWFSLGALLVLPACLAVLAVSMRRDRESIRWLAAACLVVMASFAIHYLLAIRYTQDSESLQRFWQFAMPPRDAGVGGTLRWLYSQLEPFAQKPGGTGNGPSFWIAAALGVALASARLLGLAAGLVVLSGLALAAFRIMPLYERLSLWFLPALYLSIALFADRAILFIRQMSVKQSSLRLVGSGLILALLAGVCVDIVDRGVHSLRYGRPRDSNRDTDDRAAVAWLMQQRQPGDILITTAHAQPAIWWYGGIPLSEGGGRQFADGGRLLVAEHHKSQRVCRGREPETVIDGRHRIQLYLGFTDTPADFDDLLLERLSKFGAITAVQHFGGASRAAVIDPSAAAGSTLFWKDASIDRGASLGGCIVVGRARPW